MDLHRQILGFLQAVEHADLKRLSDFLVTVFLLGNFLVVAVLKQSTVEGN